MAASGEYATTTGDTTSPDVGRAFGPRITITQAFNVYATKVSDEGTQGIAMTEQAFNVFFAILNSVIALWLYLSGDYAQATFHFVAWFTDRS